MPSPSSLLPLLTPSYHFSLQSRSESQQNRKAGKAPSRAAEELSRPGSAAAKGYDDELERNVDERSNSKSAAAAAPAAAAKRAAAAAPFPASTPRTPQLPSRPISSSKNDKKEQQEEELPFDPTRVPSPAPLEDEEFDVAAAAAAAARSDAALFPEEVQQNKKHKKKDNDSSSSDDDDDDDEDNEALRKRPTGGDGGSSTDDDDGYRGVGGALVGSRSAFLSFVDETREMRAPARSAARDADERKKRRRAEEKKRAKDGKVAAPEQPRRGELVHAGKAEAEEEEEKVEEVEVDEKKNSKSKSKKSQPLLPPSSSFEAAGLSPSTSAHLRSLGFARPTPVQASAMPALCGGRDALVRAPTGSGKTLAYLAPIVDAISGARACFLNSSSSSSSNSSTSSAASIASRGARALGSRAIVLAPTRELALQVTDVAAALTKRYHWVVGGALYG